MIEPKITSIFDELIENSSIEVGHSMTAITLGFFFNRLVLIEYVESSDGPLLNCIESIRCELYDRAKKYAKIRRTRRELVD